MTQLGPTPTPVASRSSVAVAPSFLEWGPVIAGAFLAAALSFVLLTFGAAIGLSATSPWPSSGLSAKMAASVAVFWIMVQQIGAFMAGAYVAGRMRTRWLEASQHEVEFRDGLHGGLVWAVGVVIGAALLMATAGAVARTGTEVAGKAVASAASSTANPMDVVLDSMFRPGPAPAAGPGAAARQAPQQQTTAETRARSRSHPGGFGCHRDDVER